MTWDKEGGDRPSGISVFPQSPQSPQSLQSPSSTVQGDVSFGAGSGFTGCEVENDAEFLRDWMSNDKTIDSFMRQFPSKHRREAAHCLCLVGIVSMQEVIGTGFEMNGLQGLLELTSFLVQGKSRPGAEVTREQASPLPQVETRIAQPSWAAPRISAGAWHDGTSTSCHQRTVELTAPVHTNVLWSDTSSIPHSQTTIRAEVITPSDASTASATLSTTASSSRHQPGRRGLSSGAAQEKSASSLPEAAPTTRRPLATARGPASPPATRRTLATNTATSSTSSMPQQSIRKNINQQVNSAPSRGRAQDTSRGTARLSQSGSVSSRDGGSVTSRTSSSPGTPRRTLKSSRQLTPPGGRLAASTGSLRGGAPPPRVSTKRLSLGGVNAKSRDGKG